MNRLPSFSRGRGFSLIEVLLSLGVAAVLLAASFFVYANVSESAKTRQGQDQVRNISAGIRALFPHGDYAHLNNRVALDAGILHWRGIRPDLGHSCGERPGNGQPQPARRPRPARYPSYHRGVQRRRPGQHPLRRALIFRSPHRGSHARRGRGILNAFPHDVLAMPKLPLLADTAHSLVEESFLLSHEDFPFSYHFEAGDGRVVILAGDNSSGKSLLGQVIAAKAHIVHQVSPMVASMARRTAEGMGRAIIYEDEQYHPTGRTSVSVALKALRNLSTRLEEEGAGLAILDEPDIGLSEGFAYAFGEKMAAMINALPQEGAWGALIISHSRQLAQGLVDHLARRPTFVHTSEPKTLDAWLAENPRRSVADLEAMIDGWGPQFRMVTAILDEAQTLKDEADAPAQDEAPPSNPPPRARKRRAKSP